MAFKMTNPFKQTKFPNSPGAIKRKFKKWIKGSESASEFLQNRAKILKTLKSSSKPK